MDMFQEEKVQTGVAHWASFTVQTSGMSQQFHFPEPRSINCGTRLSRILTIEIPTED
jgi:hypothetical protein